MEANLSPFEWTFFGISLFLCILSILGNGLICRAIFHRKRKSIVYLLIAYQATSDIIYGVSRVTGYLLCHSTLFTYSRYQVLGCEVVNLVIPTACYSVSAHCMTVIAYYRFKMVHHFGAKKPSVDNLKYKVTLIWTMSILSAILVNVGLEIDANPAHSSDCITLFAEAAAYDFFKKYYALSIGFVVTCLIPYVATCVFYILIIKKISSQPNVGHVTSERERRSQEQKNRMTKMLIVIFVSYYALTLPVTVSVHFFTVVTGKKYKSCGTIDFFSKSFVGLIMVSLSTVVNPVILYHFDETFRNETRRAFSGKKSLKYDVNSRSFTWTKSNQLTSTKCLESSQL
ncbi:hypothetical protein HDE_05974 [Halotydeus destructor]|nr:hypothetical protein HDE_05974 [Halotydeus destructor]